MSEQEITNSTVFYLKNLFRDYYTKNKVLSPIAIETREIGIGEFGKKISSRHLSFSNLEYFNKYLRDFAPFFVSYSMAYYKFPSMRPMENKQMYASDIVYEFDADDFDLPCKNEHDIWFCKSCNSHGKGHRSQCPECNNKTEVIEWTCEECLGHAKNETLRLMDFLENDFNIDPSSFVVSFSGSKGYHLRITDKNIISLSKASRLQMINYLLGKNINLEQLGFEFKNKQWRSPSANSLGFSSKILSFIKDYIQKTTIEQLVFDLNITKPKATKVFKNKEVILNKMDNNILWHNFSKDAKTDAKFWEDLLNLAISKISFRIDPTSSDIYKIMRMPDTIHGGTGFLSSTLKSKDDLKNFDAFYDPIIFNKNQLREIEIIKPIYKFKLINQEFGPYIIGEKIELPEAVSVFLLLKGVAK